MDSARTDGSAWMKANDLSYARRGMSLNRLAAEVSSGRESSSSSEAASLEADVDVAVEGVAGTAACEYERKKEKKEGQIGGIDHV